MAVNMWKNSLKNVESDSNKILYKTLLNFFLQWNSTYFLNKPRIMHTTWAKRPRKFLEIKYFLNTDDYHNREVNYKF